LLALLQPQLVLLLLLSLYLVYLVLIISWVVMKVFLQILLKRWRLN
jgi:hypothetical protein